jgi:hypothetical protein
MSWRVQHHLKASTFKYLQRCFRPSIIPWHHAALEPQLTMPAILSPEGNPFSGLATLPAETAVLYEVMRYVYVLGLGVGAVLT